MAGLIAPTSASKAVADEHVSTPRGLGIRLVDVPVASAENPRALVYIIDHVQPGSEVERRVQVVNGTRRPAEVSLYAAAADIKGGNFVGAEGRTQNELSSWTEVTPASVHLSPGGRTFAKVDIDIPSDAPPGEQYATVWAQVTAPPGDSGGVRQVSRVGVRVYLSVGPGGEPASDFAIRSFTAARDDKGAPVVQLMVDNTGGRALDLTGELTLSDGPGGLSAGPFDLSVGITLGVGRAEPVTVTLPRALPDGPWRARATLRSGLLERSAAGTLTFPEAGTAEAVPAEAEGQAPSWLLGGIAAGALLALLAALTWYLNRRRGRRSHEAAIPPVSGSGP